MGKNQAGFTLMEIMITLAILAVLSGIAVPNYRRTVEVSRSQEAKSNLNIIHMGEKVYLLNNSTFWGTGAVSLSTANTNLNTDMAGSYYDLISVTQSNGGLTYTAVIRRNNTEGGAGSKTFTNTYVCTAVNTCPATLPVPAESGNY